MSTLSIVIPCFNEEKNIPLILERFSEVIEPDDTELILVNNGSTDDSRRVLDELLPRYKFARSLEIYENIGYGNGILQGLNSANGEYLAWTHADMQTDPFDVAKAWRLMKEQECMRKTFIKGLRKGRPLFDQLFTVGMSFFETTLLGKFFWDINAQPNLFHRDFFNSWKEPPSDFSLDLYVYFTAKAKGLKVIRFDVIFPERLHGKSSWNNGLLSKWKFIKRTVTFSINLKRRLK